MTNRYKLFLLILLAAAVVTMVTACGGKPFNYHPIHEIPEGPGILTDKPDGAVLYDSKGGGYIQQKMGNKSKGQTTAETEKPAMTKTDEVDSDHSDFEEFEEFRRWKKWREQAGDSDEYQEFLEWREWKSYQEWKQRQPKSD